MTFSVKFYHYNYYTEIFLIRQQNLNLSQKDMICFLEYFKFSNQFLNIQHTITIHFKQFLHAKIC